ncbi:MAG: hypothetical protein KAS23_15240 [Anaerohalosphaera sp.]|nr:hypothetical protein [Anaerohalosphaera sp.]
MTKNTILSIIVILLALAITATGCGKKEKETPQPTADKDQVQAQPGIPVEPGIPAIVVTPANNPDDQTKPEPKVVVDSVPFVPESYYSGDLAITSYDGIPFGTTLSEINTYLEKIKGIRKVNGGNPYLYRVPTKTYYAYCTDRDNGALYSEVTVYFKDNKIVMFKDVISRKLFSDETPEKAQALFNKLTSELTAKWGKPEYKSSERITWIRDDVTANLTIELPDNSYGLPIVKITMWKN